jgi:hypothetical protein
MLTVPAWAKQEFLAKTIQCGMFVLIDNYAHNVYIYIAEYRSIDPATEREIFQRVQLGVPLTAAGRILNLAFGNQLTILIREITGRGVALGRMDW